MHKIVIIYRALLTNVSANGLDMFNHILAKYR